MTSPADTPRPRNVLLLCISQDFGAQFLSAVTATCGAGGRRLVAGGETLDLEVLAGDPRLNPAWPDLLKKGDGYLLLLRHLDHISMDKVQAIYSHLLRDAYGPLAVFVVREPGELEFKVSCLACGQKLLVRDSDVNKTGRCPYCKEAFRLMAQTEYVRSQLRLPDAVPVARVCPTDPAPIQAALLELAQRIRRPAVSALEMRDDQAAKRATTRIQITES